MSDRSTHPIRRWLAAERAGRDEEAERALTLAFRSLSDPEVSPRFARAVLARIGSATPPMPLGWRIAIAALLVVTSVSVIYAPWVVFALRSVLGVGGLVEFIGDVIVQSSRGIVSWLTLWQTAGEINRILLNLLSRPAVAVVVLATMGLAAVALRLLFGLLTADRSRSYV